MSPQEIYLQNIEHYTLRLKQIKRFRNLITLLKLITFGTFGFGIYILTTQSTFSFLYLSILSLGIFIILTLTDSKIVYKQTILEGLISVNQYENEYLEGNLNPFPTGQSYSSSDHPYACDLDLFGEDSLFQHLNRTVTANGTEYLVSWLLSLSKDPEIIRQRQQATAELSTYIEWCHTFRALGNMHPTQIMDTEIFRKWQAQPGFFKNIRNTRFFLYSANVLTIGSWGISATGMLPWTFSLLFSFLQLAVLALFLKKINRYHGQLNVILRTVSNYLPLVKLIHEQTFRTSGLQEIQNMLFAPDRNAQKAIALLNKIQEGLDQRGNVLLAFVLNGLYLKDLHLIIRLDKWKKEYSSHLPAWTEAISKTDTLISMANYRFNHPHYCVPVISENLLLEVRDAGHPLLKGKRNITNDFKVDALHQLFIVTGANMAGKSTFLRTIGINLVLAQSGNVVHSTYFAFQPIALFTSMRTTDNLAKDTSYFHAELLRLKQLITLASQEEKVFIILDEMLKGTNSVDKLNGSLAFLQKLISYPISGLVATHDLALGELAHAFPENFNNICFEITPCGSDILYDYKLYPGISNTMNATILLKQMGLI